MFLAASGTAALLWTTIPPESDRADRYNLEASTPELAPGGTMRPTTLIPLLLVGCGSGTRIDWHEPAAADTASPVVGEP